MRRAILTVALTPVAAVACGYGLARKMAGYFENPREWAERTADDTLDYFGGYYAREVLRIEPIAVDFDHHPIPNEGSTTS
jgi:hypothetical protein